MNASVIARIVKIVPLAVVAAVGVAACGSPETGALAAPTAVRSAASVPAPAPAVSASQTPVATPSADPSTASTAAPAPTAETPAASVEVPAVAAAKAKAASKTAANPAAKTEPKPATNPAATTEPKPAAKPAPVAAGGVGITFNGLGEGQSVEVGDLVSFSVTWKNNDASGSRAVAPVVATRQFEGAPCQVVLAMAQGTLERKDASGWKSLPSLSQGGGMDYAGTGNDAAFTLGAGESRTVEYRMRLDAANHPGRLAIEADAPVPFVTSFRDMARGVLNVAVVDHHRPVVTSVSTPTAMVVGRTPTEFTFKVSSPDGAAGLRPVVVLASPGSDRVNPEDVTIEAKVGDEWKSFELDQDCEGRYRVAPSQLVGVMTGAPVSYTFRVGMAKPWQGGPLELRVGAGSDGHYGDTVTVRPDVR
ncbi:hypothetical protein P3T27_000202 [Kitasatospora sp. MAA19]|uniref:hypothetical protein n=1 Tax=Kitasatospora sp. MAA19 TaxID=3035090 RepID=UPI002474DA1D|nr:hypothetical protein [Kitasatospora sp. MAA19]MDH6703521.1 hypothetical protein [Kitasatospora sp. MAA19]